MKITLSSLLQNLHLIISVIIVVPTALIYGVAPATLLPEHLDIQVTLLIFLTF